MRRRVQRCGDLCRLGFLLASAAAPAALASSAADLFGAASLEEIVRRMRAQAGTVGPGEWIVGFGLRGAELDAVSSDHSVMVVDSSGHAGAMKSAAFRAAGITADTPDPVGCSPAPRLRGRSALSARPRPRRHTAPVAQGPRHAGPVAGCGA